MHGRIRRRRSGQRAGVTARAGAPSLGPWLPESTVPKEKQGAPHGSHQSASSNPCSCCLPARLAPSGAELVPPLSVAPGELVLVKKRFSAFLHTHLDLVLRCGDGVGEHTYTWR